MKLFIYVAVVAMLWWGKSWLKPKDDFPQAKPAASGLPLTQGLRTPETREALSPKHETNERPANPPNGQIVLPPGLVYRLKELSQIHAASAGPQESVTPTEPIPQKANAGRPVRFSDAVTENTPVLEKTSGYDLAADWVIRHFGATAWYQRTIPGERAPGAKYIADYLQEAGRKGRNACVTFGRNVVGEELTLLIVRDQERFIIPISSSSENAFDKAEGKSHLALMTEHCHPAEPIAELTKLTFRGIEENENEYKIRLAYECEFNGAAFPAKLHGLLELWQGSHCVRNPIRLVVSETEAKLGPIEVQAEYRIDKDSIAINRPIVMFVSIVEDLGIAQRGTQVLKENHAPLPSYRGLSNSLAWVVIDSKSFRPISAEE